jgi:predicted TIM-barrel fold metal-dependent hydrolase
MTVDTHAHIFPRVRGVVAAGMTRGLSYGRVLVGEMEIRLTPPFCEETICAAEMLLANMDWAGVDKAVLLQGPFYGECNRYVLEAAARCPNRLIGLAYLDPWGLDCRKTFEAIFELPGFRGIKLECSVKTGLFGIQPGRHAGYVSNRLAMG